MAMAEPRGIGPFFRIESERYDELFRTWAASREARLATGPAFVRDLGEVLSAVVKGATPRPARGIPLGSVLEMAACGLIEEAAPLPGAKGSLAEMASSMRPVPAGPGRQSSAMGVGEKLRRMRDRAAEGPERGPSRGERLLAATRDPEAWGQLLKTMSEHPGMSPRNLIAITEYRARLGVRSTQELLDAEAVERHGGTIKEGAVGVTVNRRKRFRAEDGSYHDGGGYEYVRVYSPLECEGLDPKRYRGYPMRCDTSDPGSLDRFMAATSRMDLDSLDDVSSHVFSLRYGLAAPGEDPLPAPPAGSTVAEVEGELREISERAWRLCRRVDRALKLAAAPVAGIAEGDRPVPAAPESGAGRRDEGQGRAREAQAPIDPAKVTTAQLMRALAERDSGTAGRCGIQPR